MSSAYCGNPECQSRRARKSNWQKEKLSDDTDCQAKQTETKGSGGAETRVTGEGTVGGIRPVCYDGIFILSHRYYLTITLQRGSYQGGEICHLFCVFLNPKTYCLKIKVSPFLILFSGLHLASYPNPFRSKSSCR